MTKQRVEAMFQRQEVETNHLEIFGVFGQMIWLSKFLLSGYRCEDLILLCIYLQMLND